MSLEDNIENSNSQVTKGDNTRVIGCVKWFNNKTGYGFISVLSGELKNTDIFVYHSAIKVNSQQYKYLVQGEYVEFNISPTKNENHEYQATDVTGILDGKLMCEIRRDYKILRDKEKNVESREPRSVKPPKNSTKDTQTDVDTETDVSRVRGEGPREGAWVQVISRNVNQNKEDTQSKKRGRKATTSV